MSNLALGFPGGWELLIIVGIVLLLFGSRKLPELARAMGSSITQFKKGLQDAEGSTKLPPAPGAGGTLDSGEARREKQRE